MHGHWQRNWGKDGDYFIIPWRRRESARERERNKQ